MIEGAAPQVEEIVPEVQAQPMSPEKVAKPAEPPTEASELSSVSLPVSHIRRIAKAAAPPGTKFSSEALAALHRIAQVYILYATDRAIAQAQAEAAEAKKKKIKNMPVPTGRRMTADHVMQFLTAEMAPIATKLANLMPDSMPKEFKPTSLQLLEELRVQQRKLLEPEAGGDATAAPAGPQTASMKKSGLAAWAKSSKAAAPSDGKKEGGKKRGRPAAKKPEAAAAKDGAAPEAEEEPAAKRQQLSEEGVAAADEAANVDMEAPMQEAAPAVEEAAEQEAH